MNSYILCNFGKFPIGKMYTFRKKLELLVIVFAFANTILAQNYYHLSIEELLDKGIANSIIIKESELKMSISSDQYSLSKNKKLPDLQVAGMFGYVGTSTILDTDLSFIKHPDAPDWKQNYQFIATQPLYEGGRIKNNIQRAKMQEELAQLVLQKDKSDLRLWMIGKYLNLYNLYREKETYVQNIEEANIRLKDIRKMREEGMITSNDVLRSEIQVSNYELSLQQTDNNLILASQHLSITMGMDEDLLYMPDSTFLTNDNRIQTLDDYIGDAYLNYVGLKINDKNIDLAENNLKLVRANFRPNLSLQFGNSFIRPVPNTSPVYDKYINAWSLSLNLSYHISALYDRKHSLAVAKKQINIQEWENERAKQDIRINVKTAYLRHKEAVEKVNILKNTLIMTRQNYQIVHKKYFNQLAILTDLLDANTLQLNATLQLAAARVNVVYTYYQLLNIIGDL